MFSCLIFFDDGIENIDIDKGKFPPSLTLPLSIKSLFREGENPHQKGAFYVNKSLAEFNAGTITICSPASRSWKGIFVLLERP
ncbi:hypothetical protein LIER_35694 [Lithospermum erythrorhizon]|uniref:Uncharacterized protein n=1 Tax=Lithospermum erythrorhizon TaxID=34254 RepID=A0AAV3NWQ7_LITER